MKSFLSLVFSIALCAGIFAAGSGDTAEMKGTEFSFGNSSAVFDYPGNFTAETLQSESEILRVVGDPNYKLPVIVANAYESSDRNRPDSSAALVERMMGKTPGSRDFKVISEEWVQLDGGLKAYRVELNWIFSDDAIPMETLCLLFLEGDSLYSLSGTVTPYMGPLEPVREICMTLRHE